MIEQHRVIAEDRLCDRLLALVAGPQSAHRKRGVEGVERSAAGGRLSSRLRGLPRPRRLHTDADYMERMKARFPQELLDLLDGYVHGKISRRTFLAGTQEIAPGSVTAELAHSRRPSGGSG